MRHKYIIFYQYYNGRGNCELTCKKIKSIEDIKKLEEEIKKNTNENVGITNYKDLGIIWK